jgi:penicillin-binding protein 1B
VVWVGFDDNRDFKLEGAKSALPIWTEFMKRAHAHREYRGARSFRAPDGVVSAEIDPETGMLATPSCPRVTSEVFISGTQPLDTCRLHGGGRTLIAGWEPASETPPAGQPNTVRPSSDQVAAATPRPREVKSIPVNPPAQAQAKKPERKGFFSRIRDLFK